MPNTNKRIGAWLQMLLRDRFTAKQIADAQGINIRQCHTTLRTFVKRGLIHQVSGTGKVGNPKIYQVVLGEMPSFGSGRTLARIHKKTGRQKLWNNMKIARKFTVADLLSTVSVAKTSAQEYVNKLLKAGYLEVIRPKQYFPNSEPKYLLIRDTGRLSPQVLSEGCWDRNQEKLYQYGGNKHDMAG